MTGTARIIHGNALDLPLPDESVDLVVTSPPYFGLRSYQDGGTHYEGQIGAEATPAEFVDALIAATRELVRVLKPTGSIWVNLGDKYAQSQERSRNGNGNRVAIDGFTGGKPLRGPTVTLDRKDNGPVRQKSLIGIPWRYAIRAIDDLGLILRAEVIWSKPNGLPESVTDRVRRSHETWFHFTKSPRYFSAVDEIREAYEAKPQRRFSPRWVDKVNRPDGQSANSGFSEVWTEPTAGTNPLGKLPGSVWDIPTQPLRVPDHLGVDHFAAFPMEFPRRIIRGWSPAGVCTACGEGRRPLRGRACDECGELVEVNTKTCLSCGHRRGREWLEDRSGQQEWRTDNSRPGLHAARRAKPTQVSTAQGGYACACPDTTAPTTPSVILDPFGGTGTVALMAKALGRTGISVDLSHDYCRLATWRTNDRDQLAAAMQVDKPTDKPLEGQLGLFEDGAA